MLDDSVMWLLRKWEDYVDPLRVRETERVQSGCDIERVQWWYGYRVSFDEGQWRQTIWQIIWNA